MLRSLYIFCKDIRMENNTKNEDCEIQGINSITKKEEVLSQNVQNCSETKVSTDSKNTQVRVVRGTKKMKLDVCDSNNLEKKGLYLYY